MDAELFPQPHICVCVCLCAFDTPPLASDSPQGGVRGPIRGVFVGEEKRATGDVMPAERERERECLPSAGLIDIQRPSVLNVPLAESVWYQQQRQQSKCLALVQRRERGQSVFTS